MEVVNSLKSLKSAMKKAGGPDSMLKELSIEIQATGQKFNSLTHLALMVACLGSSVKYGGDEIWDRVCKILKCMPRGSRVESMIAWVHRYWAIRIKYDDGMYSWKSLKKARLREHGGDDAANAVRTPWYDLHEEAKESRRIQLDLEKVRSRVSKLMEKAVQDGVEPDALTGLLHELADQAGEIKVQLDKAA